MKYVQNAHKDAWNSSCCCYSSHRSISDIIIQQHSQISIYAFVLPTWIHKITATYVLSCIVRQLYSSWCLRQNGYFFKPIIEFTLQNFKRLSHSTNVLYMCIKFYKGCKVTKFKGADHYQHALLLLFRANCFRQFKFSLAVVLFYFLKLSFLKILAVFYHQM